MSKFVHQFESYIDSVETIVENWFHKHFNHVTPGTPDHVVLTNATNDLKATLGVPTVQAIVQPVADTAPVETVPVAQEETQA